MTDQKSLPKWILIVSGFFALMELLVSVSMCFSPEMVLDQVDISAKGVIYVVYLWAVRQFALGVIFAFATFKKSGAMLTISYIFFLVMFIGDFFIGILQKETGLMVSAVVMCVISSAMLWSINKRE